MSADRSARPTAKHRTTAARRLRPSYGPTACRLASRPRLAGRHGQRPREVRRHPRQPMTATAPVHDSANLAPNSICLPTAPRRRASLPRRTQFDPDTTNVQAAPMPSLSIIPPTSTSRRSARAPRCLRTSRADLPWSRSAAWRFSPSCRTRARVHQTGPDTVLSTGAPTTASPGGRKRRPLFPKLCSWLDPLPTSFGPAAFQSSRVSQRSRRRPSRSRLPARRTSSSSVRRQRLRRPNSPWTSPAPAQDGAASFPGA